jgi:hypothetical protein
MLVSNEIKINLLDKTSMQCCRLARAHSPTKIQFCPLMADTRIWQRTPLSLRTSPR